MSEIDRLAKWILANCPEEIGKGNPITGESAVDVAIRMMRECMAWRASTAVQSPEEIE